MATYGTPTSGTTPNNGAPSITVPAPSGLTADTWSYAFVAAANVRVITDPTGWTAVAGPVDVDAGTGSASARLRCWRRKGIYTDNTIFVFEGGNSRGSGAILPINGLDGTTPDDVTPITNVDSISDTNLIASSITTATAATDLLCAWEPGSNSTTETLTVPAGMTQRVYQKPVANGILLVATEPRPSTGPTGTRTATTTKAVMSVAITLALRPVSTGGTSHPLAGVSVANSTIAGALGTARPLAGTLSASTTVSGESKVNRTASGTLESVSTVSGLVTVAQTFSGTLVSTSTLDAGFRLDRAVAGSLESASTANGALGIVTNHPLVGAVGATSTVSGALAGAVRVVGVVGVDSTVSGSLGATRGLVGAADTTSTVSGSVETSNSLAGALNITTNVSGSLSTAKLLAGGLNATTTVSGSVAGSIRMAGAVDAQGLSVGNLTRAISLAGMATTTSTASGAITALFSLEGVVEVGSTTVGAITVGVIVFTYKLWNNAGYISTQIGDRQVDYIPAQIGEREYAYTPGQISLWEINAGG